MPKGGFPPSFLRALVAEARMFGGRKGMPEIFEAIAKRKEEKHEQFSFAFRLRRVDHETK
jgi:hypothetical protein